MVGDGVELFDVFRLPRGEDELVETLADAVDVDVLDVDVVVLPVDVDVDGDVFFIPFFHAMILSPRYQKQSKCNACKH